MTNLLKTVALLNTKILFIIFLLTFIISCDENIEIIEKTDKTVLHKENSDIKSRINNSVNGYTLSNFQNLLNSLIK
jgi:hypothetical protein